MAKKNIMAIAEAFEGAYIRERETEEGQKFYLASESAFGIISWNIEGTEGELIMTQNEDDENLYTISNGKEEISLKVEKQIHQKVDKTWKVDGQKFSDGTTIKLNGTAKGDFEVWSNQNFNSKGKRTWKRLSIAKNETQGKKNLKKAISEYKASTQEEAEAAEA